jgi:hypothetical protein
MGVEIQREAQTEMKERHLEKVKAEDRVQGAVATPTDVRKAFPELKVAAYPTLRRAATILDVNPSSLSRRSDLTVELRGREKRIPVRSVMELAAYYRKRPLAEVASDLLDLAVEQAADFADEVEAELDAFLSDEAGQALPKIDGFLKEAKRRLPPELYEQVEATSRARLGRTGGLVSLTDDDC